MGTDLNKGVEERRKDRRSKNNVGKRGMDVRERKGERGKEGGREMDRKTENREKGKKTGHSGTKGPYF